MKMEKISKGHLAYLKTYQEEKNSKKTKSNKKNLQDPYQDKIQISDYSQKLKKIRINSKDIISSIEKFRENKLPEIKRKIKSGFYKEKSILKMTAKSIVDNLDIEI